MTELLHETSLDSAKSIICSRMICGGYDGAYHERFPHFCLSRDGLGRNVLPDGGEILLIFESDMTVIDQNEIRPEKGFIPGHILRMPAGHNSTWQAIVSPCSPPIRLIDYEVQGEDNLNKRDRRYLDKACRMKIDVDAAFFSHLQEWHRKQRLAHNAIFKLYKRAINAP